MQRFGQNRGIHISMIATPVPSKIQSSLDFVEVLPQGMTNQRYSVLVRAFMLGQFRIQLTDATVADEHAPPGHGAIVRECCTYKELTMLRVLSELAESQDPLALLRGYENDRNCELPGKGRIRLDQGP